MQVPIVTADTNAVAESRLHSTSSFKHCPSSKTNKWIVMTVKVAISDFIIK